MCGLALLGGTTSAEAAVRNWKAFTVDNLWSNPANWEEGVAPVDGDDLRFPVPGGGGPVTLVNDIANLRVHTLVTNGNYTITGQPFTLLNSLFGSGTAIYDVHITLVGDQIWTQHSYNITLNAGLTDLRRPHKSAVGRYDLRGPPVKVTFLRENNIPVQKTFPFSGRFNIAVGGPQVPEITNERFGVLIESSEPIAVERALYWDAGGVTWAAGSNATATRLP
jgi:hypothetical protein